MNLNLFLNLIIKKIFKIQTLFFQIIANQIK